MVPKLTQFTRTEIQELFKQAIPVYRHPGFDIRIAPAKYTYGRILIITPKKMGTAPARNLARRRIKAIFAQEKLYTNPFDTIIFCKKEITCVNFQELKNILVSIITPQ